MHLKGGNLIQEFNLNSHLVCLKAFSEIEDSRINK